MTPPKLKKKMTIHMRMIEIWISSFPSSFKTKYMAPKARKAITISEKKIHSLVGDKNHLLCCSVTYISTKLFFFNNKNRLIVYFIQYYIIFSNSFSFIILTPNFLALSYLEPGSSPAKT